MFQSNSITNIAPAFLRAQRKMGSAVKGSKNPFFKSSYADLGSVMEVVKEPLNSEGIAILQPPAYLNEQGKHVVETILLHESGELFVSAMVLEVTKVNMQDLGSAISYARRYSLQSICFVPAEDDDGEKSMPREAAKETKTPASFKTAKKSATEKLEEAVKVAVERTYTPPLGFAGNGKAPEVEDNW